MSAPGAPPEELRPALVALDLPARLAAERAAQGLPADPPVCVPAWPDLALLCARVVRGEDRRLLRTSELAGRAPEAVLAQLRDRARTRLAAAELRPVEGTPHRFLQLVDPDGAAAAWFFPEELAARLGEPPLRIAVPVDGILIAWRASGEELDRIGAVAAREAYDQGARQGVGVSPRVVDWDGVTFTTFGQAVARPPSP